MSVSRTDVGLQRDLQLLEALCTPEAMRGGGLGVTRIAEVTGRHKSQVSRALASMREAGLVDRDPETRVYSCGWRIYALAAATGESRLVQTAGPFVRRLVLKVRETAHLCVLRGHTVVTLVSETSPDAFHSKERERSSASPSLGSASRALISGWEDKDGETGGAKEEAG
ncbi:helix-turn-helix domain-containing protein [Streptomyces sp. NPDC051133]|uniref:helix-turn-helix domain-containing protein n=1 Tax=Streptomyces sp. NPDC051133 TaxID=3155521 RepID=UPI00341FC18B